MKDQSRVCAQKCRKESLFKQSGIFIHYLIMRQSGVLAKYSSAETADVRFVRFSTFTKEELESWSVAEITQTRLYEGMKPVRGGPNDLRLGVSTLDQKCQTCGQTRECQGHFGHIKLNQPVFHYGFMEYVEKILKCICHNCSKLKIFQNDQQRQKFRRIIHIAQPTKRLNQLAKLLAPINKCPFQEQEDEEEDVRNKGCGSTIPTRISLRNHRIIIEEKVTSGEEAAKKKETVYTAQKVRNIFQKISSADSKLLGFLVTKPIDLLISTLAVAPPQIRPSIEMNPQKRAEDDITAAYVRIISINNQLKTHIESSERSNKILEMEKIIASIMVKVDRVNLQKPGGGKKKKTLKAIKSIEERLKSKEGRFRQHLMGKRVDFSARSVVSPDSNLALDELGVPQKIARSLTIPQQVTETNYARMVKLCIQGKVKYILKPSQDKKKYDDIINFVKVHDKENQIEKYLNYGMIVERNLENGDYVLFNRQPTLHRMSMMGHRVRILPYNTFRLNLSVCTPYNADFDGDQMNMHVPQSYETISELKHITHVPKQIVAPKNNAPVMGIVQDALLGIYLFTMRDTFLTREEVMNLVIWIDSKEGKGQGNYQLQPGELPMPAILKPEPLWTGKQIMSMIIPEKITIEIWKSKDGLRNRDDSSMIIRKGQLLSGALQKQVVGSGAGGLVHSIWLDIGPDATNEFVTIAQRIVNNWLMTNSFTVGAADCVPDQQLQSNIVSQINEINNLYYGILNKYRNEEKIISENLHQRGKKVIDSFQYNINMNLNNRLSTMQKIVSEKVSPYLNCIYKMITAKSKGSQTNLTQIMFCLGNQNVDGRRCPLGFARRALPHFSKDDNSPESRGFVFSSFYKGLKPHEFFFHSMGGREGLSDTAVKTSRTGYIQRKLVKSLEDIVIQYDGTVRDSQNNLLQKLYGEDSFSAEYIEKHKISDVDLSEQAFKTKYTWDRKVLESRWKLDDAKVKRLNEEVDMLNRCRVRLREIFVIGKDNSDVEYYAPIKIQRLINKIKAMTRQKNPEIVSPLFVFQNVERLVNECLLPQTAFDYQQILEKYAGVEKESKKNEFIKKKREFQQENGLELFRIHIRMFLSSKAICENYKISEKCFLGLLQEIKTKFNQSLAPAGEAIGSVAAQSIGEPTTQMTLNTFHLAGVSDKNVTLGVPRLQELLDASKNIKTPNTTIFYYKPLLHSARNTEEVTKILASVISFDFPERHVKDFLEASRIYYDADPQQSNIGAPTQELLKQEKRTPWVISLVFDKKKLTSKQPWNEICSNIDKIFQDNFEISEKVGFGEEKPPEIMLRCYQKVADLLPKESKQEQGTFFRFCNIVQAEIKKIFVSGVRGIKTVKTSRRVIFNGDHRDELSKKKKDQYEFIVFQAQGTNLREILSHPKIDPYRSYSNDITEIFNVLGIEAARSSFINQFKQILKPYSIYVNHRHLSVLADWMSTRGVLTAINRNGINRVRDVSILRKASFEETTDILFGAAVFSEVDQLRGVSERIIFGEAVKIGTRSFEVMIDRDNVQNFHTKGKKDREHDVEEKEEVNWQAEGGFTGGRTPVVGGMDTPYVRVGASIRDQNRSSYYVGVGSPAFMTPSYEPSQREFSEHRMDEYPASSPMPRTPFLMNPSGTPILPGGLSAMSPIYNPGNTSFHGNSIHRPSSALRSPSYHYQGSVSNSPNYSSLKSHSPDYNSPMGSMGSSGRYGNSPNYSPSPMDQNREFFKNQENDFEEEDDE